MAITWTTLSVNPQKKEKVEVAQILAAVTTAANGEWFNSSDTERIVIDVQGIAGGATVTITGSNEATIPAATDHERTIGSAVSADGFVALEAHQIPRWMKIRKSATGSGAVDVFVRRVRNVEF